MTREEEEALRAGQGSCKKQEWVESQSPKHRVEERESTLFPYPKHPKVSKAGKKFR